MSIIQNTNVLWEAEIKETQFKASSCKSVSERDSISKNKVSISVHICNPALWEVKVGDVWSEIHFGKKMRPYLKNNYNIKSCECGSRGRVLASLV